jgi:formylglycine-generating enzyme required for sulfatase activity
VPDATPPPPDEAAPARDDTRTLASLVGSRPTISLPDLPDDDAIPQTPPSTPPLRAGRYVVQGELARGGIGTVHRGRDQELGREVAIKFLHEQHRRRENVLQRFVEEAQIGGQLQHPGIVPVYELGVAGERPFIAMKFVRGETLASRLEARASLTDGRHAILTIFESICQAIAYAHARGVLHRDLKPSNVMIGSFGEVQVVDWGLSKVLGRGSGVDAEARSAEDTIETIRTADGGTRSLDGSILGTPAYMPPEQASGDLGRMDQRSDVFALGAILCEILTGAPPYTGSTTAETLLAATRARLEDATERLDRCEAGPDLVRLAHACLAPDPADRPADASVVAKAIREHLASAEHRAQEARIEAARATERARALQRTQRLGVALVAAVTLGLAASLWLWSIADRQRDRAQDAARREQTARQDAESNLQNFNRLANLVHLDDARASADELEPPWPAQIPSMRRWLDEEAGRLRDALPELRTTLAALEAHGTAPTAEQRARALAEFPRARELGIAERKLAWLQLAAAVRSGERDVPEPAGGTPDDLPSAPQARQEFARQLVMPGREDFGREIEAYAVAESALADAERLLLPADDQLHCLDTLAWASLAVGLDRQAAVLGDRALAMAESTGDIDLIADYRRNRQALDLEIARASGPEGEAELAAAQANLDGLRFDLDSRLEWHFEDPARRFLHATLRRLVREVEAFENTVRARVEQDLAWAERVEELTIDRFRDRWEEARRAILAADGDLASTLYASPAIDLEPQVGLVPLGMNESTGLWEFLHLRSAWDPHRITDPAAIELPERAADGGFHMVGQGIVFVLIPGGEFAMGAQRGGPAWPNYDPAALQDERPQTVALAPYFLAKYEMTQGQWARLTDGEHPSNYKIGAKYSGIPERITDASPVEMVTWEESDRLLRHHGLRLPTEAQWERAARGGTSTPWYTGTTVDSLAGHINLLDQTGANVPPRWGRGESFDDGYKGPAEVGTFLPNPFGLYDVLGNVGEHCADWYYLQSGGFDRREGDGLGRPGPDPTDRVARGGDHISHAARCRVSGREAWRPDERTARIGLRPARSID